MIGRSAAKPKWGVPVSIASGIVLTLVMIGVALFAQHPTTLQMFVFRVATSLAAAGLGATIPGFLRVRIPWLHAGGALCLFVIVYLINPPSLVSTLPEEVPETVLTVVDGKGSHVCVFPGDLCPIKRELLGGAIAAVEINPLVLDKIANSGFHEGDVITIINDLDPDKWMRGRIFMLKPIVREGRELSRQHCIIAVGSRSRVALGIGDIEVGHVDSPTRKGHRIRVILSSDWTPPS